MEKLTEAQKQEIIKRLGERGAKLPCPRCGNKEFTVLDGYFSQSIHTKIGAGVIIGGATVPSAVIACKRCGYLVQHALGILGLLPEEGGSDV